MDSTGISQAKQDLQGKGGIYIWFCHVTGLFYLGSALSFFGKNGRLSNYLMKSRLTGPKPYISKDIANALLTYGYESFTLIIIEQFPTTDIIKSVLLYKEQLWMLLYPTYNRSLTVGSNDGTPMLEEDRQNMSTTVYQYEVDSNGIIAGSEQTHSGIKQLIRTGFFSIFNPSVMIAISYFDLNYLLTSGALFKNRFLFTTTQLVGDALTNWVLPFSYASSNTPVTGVDTRTSGVWVYKYLGPDHIYTESDLIKFVPTVKQCMTEYNISKTHLQRLRRYHSNHKGLMFSNNKLHDIK